MPPLSPRATRRALLGTTAAVPWLAGCSATGSHSGSASAAASLAASAADDTALLARLVSTVRALAGAPAPWGALHAHQLTALGADGSPGTAAPSSTQGSRLDLLGERRLHADLLAGCLAAHNADLARLLASLAAGMAQFLDQAGR